MELFISLSQKKMFVVKDESDGSYYMGKKQWGYMREKALQYTKEDAHQTVEALTKNDREQHGRGKYVVQPYDKD